METTTKAFSFAKNMTTTLTQQLGGQLKRPVVAAGYGLTAAIGISVVLGLSYVIAEGGRSKY